MLAIQGLYLHESGSSLTICYLTATKMFYCSLLVACCLMKVVSFYRHRTCETISLICWGRNYKASQINNLVGVDYQDGKAKKLPEYRLQ